MKRVFAYLGLGLVLYAVFLLGTLPAPWAYAWGKPYLGNVNLYGLSGSVWDGRAVSAQVGQTRLEKLHWTLRPALLLRGRLGAALEFDYRAQPGALKAARAWDGQWYFTDVSLRFPARDIEPLLRLPATELGGRVDVQLDELVLAQGRISAAQGVLSWEEAAVVKPVAADLGGFSLTLETADEGVKGVLKDQGGAVQADGLLNLKPDGSYDFTATLASGDPRQPAIAQGLQLFGQPGADGRVKVNNKGTLPLLGPGGA